MKIVGTIKSLLRKRDKALLAAPPTRGNWVTILDSFTGAWQQHVEVSPENAFTHPTAYACTTRIAADIAKLGLRLMAQRSLIWTEAWWDTSIYPVLKRPNPFQTRQQFIETWMLSKLSRGNAYILKMRDAQGTVVRMYPLEPTRVTPLISDGGEVFYQLGQDSLSRLPKDIPAIPASEIIHDRMNCLFHPLVGIPPLYAGALAVTQGLNIQRNSAKFFGNASMPSGVLTAPATIPDTVAQRIKEYWQTGFTGENAGRVAVLGDGLKYEAIAFTPLDAQMIEQVKWSDEKICSVFGVPPYKVYVGGGPTYSNAEFYDLNYYTGCLQSHIEAIEALLDEALALPQGYRTEFDIDDLTRMDLATRMQASVDGVGGGILSPNEARQKFNLKAADGGDTPYLQQQNYSLAALAKRDARADPFGTAPAPAAPPPEPKRASLKSMRQRLNPESMP